ncbi:FtsK/SpoIIIE domain-containing protein [Halostreptopolyspora alba]|uniref:FtsK domain-containing protein n=1 Tax=Halostreptopolyspora alba TaxID=2487137 RepID=A0A3N0DYP8_9ACTN|nr:hypothetical protein EFW17_22500 [Nocardiopsaceae bacterium YIM 96095]
MTAPQEHEQQERRRHLAAVPEAGPEPGAQPTVRTVPGHVVGTSAASGWAGAAGRRLGALLRAGLARHAALARDWIADNEVEHRARLAARRRITRDRVHAEKRQAKGKTEAQKADAEVQLARAQREPGEIEVTARMAGIRSMRAAVCAAVPTGVVAGPVYLTLAQGEWATLLAWPAVAGYLAVQEWAAGTPTGGAVAPGSAPVAHAAPSQAHPPEAPVSTGAGPSVLDPDPEPEAGQDPPVVARSESEQRVLARLRRWAESAAERNMRGVQAGEPVLDELGIWVRLHLSGRWTPDRVRKHEDQLRSMLGVATRTRTQLLAGAADDDMVLRIRTRSRDLDTTWSPTSHGLGLDTDTGEPVDISDADRMLVCGASGSGKSWALRPLMARTVRTHHDHLIYLDAKGEEGRLWRGRARVATSPAEIDQVVSELHHEMVRRGQAMVGTTWQGPRLVVVVDEGRVVLSNCEKATIQALIDISAMGRSRGIVLRWCTQYPTTSGEQPGVHKQILPNVDQQLCLRVRSAIHARVGLGDEYAHYKPQEIPTEAQGAAYLAGYGPTLIQGWRLDDTAVAELPERDPWHYGQDDADVEEEDDWIGAQHAVTAALRDAGGQASQSALVEATGYSPSAVKQALKELKGAGRVTKGESHRAPWRLL